MKITLQDPVVVSQAPPDLRGWGPWQFPLLHRLEDGRLLVEFHREADSATAYGLPMGQAVSVDQGSSWQEMDSPPIAAGLRLPNGDVLRAIQRPSPPAAGLALPAPLALLPSSYQVSYTYYRRAELPAGLRAGWWFRRRAAGAGEWLEESAELALPDDLVYTTEGVFVFPYFEHDRIHLTPEGRLLATLYGLPQVANGRTIVRRFQAMLTESVDQGYTWQVKSVIPYSPDQDADPAWDGRDGFTEPQIGYLPDGSLLCLLRTTDGNGVGPLYSCRSTDGGASWSRPRVFDDLGVWPQLLTLGCGVTLAVYGRPGLYLRASADPAGQRWQTRLTLRQPGPLGRDTCSYADLISLGKNEALLVYSDFEFPDPQGRPCKTILARRIAVGG